MSSYPQEIMQDITNRNIVFGYFQIPIPNKKMDGHSTSMGHICIAMKRPGKDSKDRTYKISYSFCSPLDNFSKKTARHLALSKLATTVVNPDKTTVVYTIKAEEDDTLRDIFYKALVYAMSHTKKTGYICSGSDKSICPRWLYNAVIVNNGPILFGRKQGFQHELKFAELITNYNS